MLPALLAVTFATLVVAAVGRRPCPDCGAEVPGLLSPRGKTRRMWMAAGSRCSFCGCEVNAVGRKVTPEVQPNGLAAVQGLALAVSLAVMLAVGALQVVG